MGAFVLDSANKIKGVALAVAIALHGVAGFGVANMQIKTLTPPKITPPLEVEFIKPEPKPEPEKIILNNLESPEPVVVNQPVQQQVARPQTAGAAPIQQSESETKKAVTEKKTQQPNTSKHTASIKSDNKPADDIARQQAQQAAFEAEQRRLEHERLERERLEHIARQEQLERERLAKEQAQKEQLAKEQAERERKQREAQEKARAEAEAAARRQAEADALAKKQADEARRQAQQGQGSQGNGKDKKNDDGKKGGKDDNNQQGQIISGQNLGSISNASWIRKPDYRGVNSAEIKGNISGTATLTIDAKGSITGVSGVSTGDRELDRQIMREIRRAKLKPFKQGNNTLTGTATYPFDITLKN